jgi:hypothetical protein
MLRRGADMNNNYDVYMCRVQSDDLEEDARRTRLLTTSPHELLQFASPFDRMPSKLEMDGMMAIFKREYCFGDKDE